MLKVVLIPELENNYSFIGINEATKQAFVVDPASSENTLSYCCKNNLKITHVLNTHHHHDHIGGNKAIKHATNCQIVASQNDASKIPEVDFKVAGSEELIINDFKLKVLALHGHTLGHVGFYFPYENILFCGDALFSGGCGRVFEGTYEMMFKSLQKIASLPDNTLIYCAHEYTLSNLNFALTIDPENKDLKDYFKQVTLMRAENTPTIPSNLALELKINPFLRIEKLLYFTEKDILKNWTILRKLKDSF